MDKTKLITDNLKKLDEVLSGAGHWDNGDLVELLKVRSRFILDVCSKIDCEAAQGGQRYEFGDKVATAEINQAEINYQRKLNAAIEKAREKSMVRHELPAAIGVDGCGMEVYKSCPHGINAKVGSGYCTSRCPYFASSGKQWGATVYCWYPEKRRQR